MALDYLGYFDYSVASFDKITIRSSHVSYQVGPRFQSNRHYAQ